MKPLAPRLLIVSVAGLGGVLQTLGLAPFDHWYLIPVGLAAWLWGLKRRPVLASFAFGLGLFGAGAHWIWVSMVQISATPIPIAVLLETLFIAGLASVVAATGWLYAHTTGSDWIRFPALIVVSEGVRTYLLTGFPWLFAGYGLTDSPFAPWASIVGVVGLSAGLGIVAVAISRPRQGWVVAPLVAVMAFVSPAPTPSDETVTVRLVQGNVPANRKWDPQWRERIVERHVQPTLEADTDWIVWSENAVPLLRGDADQFFAQWDQLLSDQALIVGRLIEGPADRSRRYYNALAGYGTATGAQYKQRLVPFGEYVPLENQLRGLIDFFDLPLSTIIAGQSPTPLVVGDTPVAGLICYEIAYPALAWQRARGAQAIITVSNDAWFGTSIARDQHFQMAKMRAIELGLPVIRATNDGISAVIGMDGQVLAQMENFQAGYLDGEFRLPAGSTFYRHSGPFFGYGLAVFALLCCGLLPRIRRAR